MPATRSLKGAARRNSAISIGFALALAWAAWAGCIGALDVRSRRVSNRWFVGALPLALGTLWHRHPSINLALLMGGAGLTVALALNLPAWLRGWTGGADVKAYALVGLGFGAWHLLEIFLATSLLFGLAALAFWLRGGVKPKRLAMLPALGISLCAWLVSGPWWWGDKLF